MGRDLLLLICLVVSPVGRKCSRWFKLFKLKLSGRQLTVSRISNSTGKLPIIKPSDVYEKVHLTLEIDIFPALV